MKTNQQDPFQTLFDPLKVDISDRGFSKQVMQRLPTHKKREESATILFFGLIGVVLFVMTGGASLLIKELLGLVEQVVTFHIPTLRNIGAYLIMVISICYLGYEFLQSQRS